MWPRFNDLSFIIPETSIKSAALSTITDSEIFLMQEDLAKYGMKVEKIFIDRIVGVSQENVCKIIDLTNSLEQDLPISYIKAQEATKIAEIFGKKWKRLFGKINKPFFLNLNKKVET